MESQLRTPSDAGVRQLACAYAMAALVHEIWESIEDGMALHTCCFAGPLGDACRATLPAGSRLLRTFVARSHFEAMTIYHQHLDRERFASDEPQDRLPYPEEWLDMQSGKTG